LNREMSTRTKSRQTSVEPRKATRGLDEENKNQLQLNREMSTLTKSRQTSVEPRKATRGLDEENKNQTSFQP
jgi:hypothetical protein